MGSLDRNIKKLAAKNIGGADTPADYGCSGAIKCRTASSARSSRSTGEAACSPARTASWACSAATDVRTGRKNRAGRKRPARVASVLRRRPARFPVRGSDTGSRFPPVAESAQPSKGDAAATPVLGNFPFLRPAATVPHRSFPPPALWMAGLRSPRLFSQEKAFFMGTGGVRSPRNGTQPNGVPKNTSPKTQLCRKGCPHVAGSLFLYFRIGLRFPSGRIRDRAAGAGFRFRNPATTGPGRLP